MYSLRQIDETLYELKRQKAQLLQELGTEYMNLARSKMAKLEQEHQQQQQGLHQASTTATREEPEQERIQTLLDFGNGKYMGYSKAWATQHPDRYLGSQPIPRKTNLKQASAASNEQEQTIEKIQT